jgi:hypothetical protein
MSDYIDRSRTNLQAVLTRLDSILIPHGFSFQANASGVSSAGTFANGFYGPREHHHSDDRRKSPRLQEGH